MTNKLWHLLNFIIASIMVIVCISFTIAKFAAGLYWFFVVYAVLTGAEGLYAWCHLKKYLELR